MAMVRQNLMPEGRWPHLSFSKTWRTSDVSLVFRNIWFRIAVGASSRQAELHLSCGLVIMDESKASVPNLRQRFPGSGQVSGEQVEVIEVVKPGGIKSSTQKWILDTLQFLAQLYIDTLRYLAEFWQGVLNILGLVMWVRVLGLRFPYLQRYTTSDLCYTMSTP